MFSLFILYNFNGRFYYFKFMEQSVKNSIIENVSAILKETFKDKEKQRILQYDDRLNFACPYCGDSANSRKRRGNIYLDNLTFHCFNCGHHGDYIRFMHDFDMPVGNADLDEISATIKTGHKKRKTEFDIEIFNKLEEIAVPRARLKKHFRLREIIPDDKMYTYLRSRCLHRKLERFLYNNYKNELWILNLTNTGKIAGLQIRSFDPDKVKYRTYNISKIYTYMDTEFPETDSDTLTLLNQTGITFNILQTDLFAPVYVFEGPMDAMFLTNSVGISGVGRNFDLVENLPNTRYFFDNDKAGFRKMVDKINDGKKVFMWKRFLGDLRINADIKDFNELICHMSKNRIRFDFRNDIEKYFSNDKLDIINI